jgi:hypothetical protein
VTAALVWFDVAWLYLTTDLVLQVSFFQSVSNHIISFLASVQYALRKRESKY